MLSDMVVYNQYIKQATIESVCQAIDKFNAASGGAIQLSAEGFDGDFLMRNMFGSLASAQRRVDRYAANDAQAATALAQIEETVVKVAGGFGPIEWEPSQLTWMQQNEALGIEMASKALTEAIIQDQLNTGISACVAALSGVAELVSDISATAGVSQTALNATHALFGDRSSALIAQVMNGATYHKLVGEGLANTATLFEAGNVTVVSILGKKIVITDAPALVVAGTPNKGYTLTLQSGGIVINNSSDLVTAIDTSTGNKRIQTQFQADYAFGVGIKGFGWDTANGGKSPLDAEIATSENWDKFVSCDKDTAGVLTVFDMDQ